MAALLAIMLWVQERALRRRAFHAWLRALPPLTELETLLFRTIAVGFVLLTAALLSLGPAQAGGMGGSGMPGMTIGPAEAAGA